MTRFGTPDDEARRAYREALASLPDAPEPGFPPATPAARPDPHDAYVTTFEAESAASGPLADLRVGVKDNVAVAGVPLTAGTAALDYVPDRDATVVTRLRAAGATLTGTTNCDCLALGTTSELSEHGPTANPAAPGRVPGGSSGGSAAVVAAGDCGAALGTDTGGSVRIPAAYCGVVGVKPTYGTVSRAGVVDCAPSMDHVGVLARDVATAQRVLDVGGGSDPADALPSAFDAGTVGGRVDGPTVGLVEEFFDAATDDVAATVESAATSVAEAAGGEVVAVSTPTHGEATLVNDALTLMELAAVLESEGATVPGNRAVPEKWRKALSEFVAGGPDVPPMVSDLLALGATLRDENAYGRVWRARERVVTDVAAAFDGVDLLATPTAVSPPPAFGEVTTLDDVYDTLRNTAPFNLSGHPAVSVPCGDAEDGPVGLQLVAPRGADAALLDAAATAEEAV
jgi:Asp-tRNA(Asn)/Glu-tRNA(Gln) amidotransferase A subunit family amidase